MTTHLPRCFLHSLSSLWPEKGWQLHRREPQSSCVSVFLTPIQSLVCVRAPSPHLTQDHHHCCPCDRQVLCSSIPSLSQPPSQGICQDPQFSKGWSTADQTEPKYIRHVFVRLGKPTPPTPAAREICPHLRLRALAFQTN